MKARSFFKRVPLWGKAVSLTALAADISALTQESPSAFVFTADAGPDTDTTLTIDIEVLPQVLPGWYIINGETEALPTDLSNVG